jgi:hypothetical protein
MVTPSGAGSRTRRRSGALLLTAAAAVVVLAGCTSAPAHHAPAGSYGKLPSWLPSDGTQANSMLTADVAHPAVTSEGDEVEVHLAGGSVRVEVTGPEVPGEGLPVQPEDTTCTWTVTIDHASAPTRISAADFNALDHLGTIYRVAPVPGRPRIPSVVRPGETVRFELRAAMPTGEGLMRYSGGTRSVLANWDFVVEND